MSSSKCPADRYWDYACREILGWKKIKYGGLIHMSRMLALGMYVCMYGCMFFLLYDPLILF